MKISKAGFILATALLLGCSSGPTFPVEKRFWTPNDYQDAIWKIEYKMPKGEQFPRFSNPETSMVIRKLVDAQNYEVMLDDSELGLNHRAETASQFFEQYQRLQKAYRVTDIQDKYVYAQELIEIEKFGLGLQIKYFRLGNDRILEQSDSPESSDTKYVITSNEENLLGNFNNYLDEINTEKYYGEYAPHLAEGIVTYFPKLLEAFPNANYNAMQSKANLMLKKTQIEEIKTALTNLIAQIEAKKITPASSEAL